MRATMFVTASVILALTGPAQAASSLFTPPLSFDASTANGAGATCYFTNTSAAVNTVRVQLIGVSGGQNTVVADHTFAISGGEVGGFGVVVPGPIQFFPTALLYCQFSASGGKDSIRGSIGMYVPIGSLGNTVALPAQ